MNKKSFNKKTAFTVAAFLAAAQLGMSMPQQSTEVKALGTAQTQTQTAENYESLKAEVSYNWNNSIPEKKPAACQNNGKLVLFDNSHGETTGDADWVLDGGFSEFADDLVSLGYTVREYRGVDKNGDGIIRYFDDRQAENIDKNEAVITYEAIKDADVFIMAEPNRPLSKLEYAALKKFVDSGRGIYLIGDHYNSDRNFNTWDSTEIYNGYNRSTNQEYNIGGIYGDMRNPQNAYKGWLSENFGLRFRFNAIDCKAGVSGIKSTSYSERITEGVQPILMAAGSTLAITNPDIAKGIIYFGASDETSRWPNAADAGLYFGGEAEGAYVAISKPSKGKAAFIGDSSPIEGRVAKYKREDNGQTKYLHDAYRKTRSAAKLSINIINWLADQEDYVGFDGINHAKGIATPVPMADIEKDEQMPEPWMQPCEGYNSWNTETFKFGAYNAPHGVESISVGLYEPNNTMLQAYQIASGTTYNSCIYTSTDVDYYKFSKASTGTVSISLTNLPVNYNLYLVDSEGDVLSKSENTGNKPETIFYTLSKPGIYYIKVAGYNGAHNKSLKYALKADFK